MRFSSLSYKPLIRLGFSSIEGHRKKIEAIKTYQTKVVYSPGHWPNMYILRSPAEL